MQTLKDILTNDNIKEQALEEDKWSIFKEMKDNLEKLEEIKNAFEEMMAKDETKNQIKEMTPELAKEMFERIDGLKDISKEIEKTINRVENFGIEHINDKTLNKLIEGTAKELINKDKYEHLIDENTEKEYAEKGNYSQVISSILKEASEKERLEDEGLRFAEKLIKENEFRKGERLREIDR